MEVTAQLSFVRVTPRKMGLLVDEIRGKDIQVALNSLRMSRRQKNAELLYRLLKSAVANAQQKGTIDVDTLYVKTALVGKGPTLKRWKARAKGSASRLEKRTSHVKVALAER